MPTNRRFEIPELFPQPKYIEMGEGISELSVDVRLATSNVHPIQRKALRSILTLAGVRVVANKKKYVVDAHVMDPEEYPDAFDLSNVPEEVRKDYYEVQIQGSEIFIRSPYQAGMVWAAQTVATLFKMMIDGTAVPNLIIKDWPIVPTRGLLMDCNWSNEHMGQSDWCHALDMLSSVKLNALGIGIYNCFPEYRFSAWNKPAEFMMTPISDPAEDSDPSSTSRYRYYNAKYDRWYDKTETPLMFDDDFFGELIDYGKERGITIFPYFNLLCHSTLLPRLFPELSAKTAKDKPTGYGFCLSSKAARQKLTTILDAFFEKFYPEGLEFFHLGVDGFDAFQPHPTDAGTEAAWCQCSQCKDQKHGALFADFIKWFAEYLSERGVEKLVLFSNELISKEKFLASELGTMLKKNKKLAQSIVVHYTADANKLDKAVAGLTTWIGPMGNPDNHSVYQECREQLDAALVNTIKHKTDGILVRSQYSPADLDHYALMGVRCWETADVTQDTTESLQERWNETYWLGYARDWENARQELLAASSDPVYQLCLPREYSKIPATSTKKTAPLLQPYPETPLALLAKDKNAESALTQVAAQAEKAYNAFSKMQSRVKWSTGQELALQELICSALRVKVTAEHFVLLLNIYKDTAKKAPSAKLVPVIETALQELMPHLKTMENTLPDWMLYNHMQQLGCFKLFLEKLIEQIKAKSKTLDWAFPQEWEVPEDI